MLEYIKLIIYRVSTIVRWEGRGGVYKLYISNTSLSKLHYFVLANHKLYIHLEQIEYKILVCQVSVRHYIYIYIYI